MRESHIQKIWRDGGTVLNTTLGIPSAYGAELMAHQGWDSVMVDMQHGIIDYQTAADMLTAISTTETTPLVRVPWREPSIIGKVLDAGAYGIICPMVNTRQDAEDLVAACRYAPKGNRSYGPARAVLYAGADYHKHVDETIALIAMIETREALDNLDEICSVDGLTAIYIGPADLGLSLGCAPKPDHDEAPVVSAIEQVAAAAGKHGLIAGIHNATPAYARRMIDLGFRFISISGDTMMIASQSGQILDKMRKPQ